MPSPQGGGRPTAASWPHTDAPDSVTASGDVKEREQRRSMARRWFECRRMSAPPAGALLRRRDRGFGRSHGNVRGVWRNAPPPQDRCPDQARLFALPQSNPLGDAEHEPLHGSKLRRRLTCVRQTFPAWPEGDRRLPHPASLHQSLVMISLSVRRWRESTSTAERGDNFVQISDKDLNGLRFL